MIDSYAHDNRLRVPRAKLPLGFARHWKRPVCIDGAASRRFRVPGATEVAPHGRGSLAASARNLPKISLAATVYKADEVALVVAGLATRLPRRQLQRPLRCHGARALSPARHADRPTARFAYHVRPTARKAGPKTDRATGPRPDLRSRATAARCWARSSQRPDDPTLRRAIGPGRHGQPGPGSAVLRETLGKVDPNIRL